MKYLKSFESEELRQSYISKEWTSPHIYLNKLDKSLDFEEKYTPLQYISSTQTGGQYIDLGCHLMENTDDIRIDIKFNIKNRGLNSSAQQGALICSQPESGSYPGFVLRYQNGNSERLLQLQAKWNFTGCYWKNNKGVSKYLTYDSHSSLDNNIYEFTETLDNIPSSQVNNCTCTLFCALDGSNNPFRFVEADLYYLRFTKGNIIVRDLIPVLTKNGIPGLYDKAHKKFYRSQGEVDFVVGPKL